MATLFSTPYCDIGVPVYGFMIESGGNLPHDKQWDFDSGPDEIS